MSHEFVPVLQPADWDPQDTVARQLLDRDDSPWVAYGWDFPTHFQFLRTSELKGLRLDEDDVFAIAVSNLGRRRLRLSEVPLGPSEDGVSVLSVEGAPFADAAIVDPELMRRAAVQLGTELVAAATPMRGRVLLGDGRNRLHLAALELLAAEAHATAERPPITPGLWLIAMGEIVGLTEGIEGSAEAIAARWLPPELEVLRLLGDDGRIRAVVAPLTVRDVTRLIRDARSLAGRLIAGVDRLPDFDGLCVVWVSGGEGELDPALVNGAVLEARTWARQLAAESGATDGRGRPVRVDVVYGSSLWT